MRFVLRFAAATQAVAFNRHCQYHGRLAFGFSGIGVGSVDFIRVVATAIQVHNFVVREVFNQLQQLWILPEEVLASVGPAVGFVVLQLTITHFIHATAQQAGFVFFQ